jgi:beta-glucanase (GH16 family)
MLALVRAGTALAAAVLLAGCAAGAVVWAKTDGSASDAAADLRECRVLADDQAWRMDWAMRWPPRFYDPRFMPPFYRSPRPFWLDFPQSMELEQALVDFCMHSKGYRLEQMPY